MFALEDDFTCSICLEVLNEPVSAPCGHSFCLACINKYWDQAEVCNCPQCREIFNPRPQLRKSTLLNELMEKLTMKQPHSRVAKHFDGSAMILCDFCSGEKLRAVKSCMTCLTSFCEIHIKHHNEIVAWKNHKLVNPTANIQEKLCKKHQKALEIYCRSDETCICSLCVITGHRDHDTAQPETERATKQILLGATLTEIRHKVEQKQNQIEEITQIIQQVKVVEKNFPLFQEISAVTEMDKYEKSFAELVLLIEKAHKKKKETIQEQEKREVGKAKKILDRLQKEITVLKKKHAEFTELSQTDDHIHFLQIFPLLTVPAEDDTLTNKITIADFSSEEVKRELSCVKEYLEELYQAELNNGISKGEALALMTMFEEPKSREDFLKYTHQLTLDPNTANNHIWLSEDNTKGTYRRKTQLQPDHSERFDYYSQILCKEGLTGLHCYWEVEWSSGARIGVTYLTINRKGKTDDCCLGHNEKSWSLSYSDSCFYACHNNKETEISAPYSSRIGVYVDYPSGTISFYGVSESMRLLHMYKTSITATLYPAFYLLYSESSVKISQLD